MSAKARITADFATQREVASRLRIPAARTAELRRQMSDLVVQMSDGSVVVAEMKRSRTASGQNGATEVRSRARTSSKKK